MEIPLLKDLVIIFALAACLLFVCNRLRLPTIVGFLLTGIISGPYGLAFIKNQSDVDTLSQIGIVLLLFIIGLEFSLKRLLQIKKYFFAGGVLQVSLTTLCGFCIAQLLERPAGESLFLGFLLSMSSTAIVLKALEKHDETDSPQGRVSIGILIFQDIIAVPMILLIPVLGGGSQSLDLFFLAKLTGAFAILLLVVAAALQWLPYILYHIAKVRSRELFLLSVITICFTIAWLAASMGLSLAIGAFLAGVIIAESDYSQEVFSTILPIQDLFSSLFFISIGMLLNWQFVIQQPLLIFVLVLSIMLMKAVIVGTVAASLKLPLRISVISGLALSQIGEFSFVLMKTGMDHGLGTVYHFQLFLAVAILTMALAPLLIEYSQAAADLLLRLPLPESWKSGLRPNHETVHNELDSHILIVGFGLAGKNLARVSKETLINYTIIEMNPTTVKLEKKRGEPIHYGDATHETVLKHAKIHQAKAVAVMINDPHAAKRIVALAHKLNPQAYLIVRTRYVQDTAHMYALGAHEVIPDEFGASIEIFARVLQRYGVSENKIQEFAGHLRSETLKPQTVI